MSKTMSRITLATCLVLSVVGVGCSGSGSSASSGFCEAMRNRDVALAVKDADGNVDKSALQASLDSLVSKAPKDQKADVTYLSKVMVAYVKVNENSMSVADFKKAYPDATIQQVKDRLNAYLKPKCNFTV